MQYKKIFQAIAISAAIGLISLPASATRIDSYFIGDDKKRDYKSSAKEVDDGITECGVVAVTTMGNKDILKIDFSTRKLTKNRPKNLTGYKTAFTAEVGGINRRSKGYDKYPISKGEIIADWISRRININEFPSNTVQLGGYFANYLSVKKFYVIVEYESPAGKQQQIAEFNLLYENAGAQELGDYVVCTNMLHGLKAQ